jgi:WD40 repeat protein
MSRFASLRGIGLFAVRYWRAWLVLVLALTAAGGYWSWREWPRPRTAWEIPDFSWQTKLADDGSLFLGLTHKQVPLGAGTRGWRDVGPVRIWDTATGEERLRLLGDHYLLAAIRLSPDGRRLAVVDHRGGLTVWDATTGHLLATPATSGEGPERPRPARDVRGHRDIRFSPDSRLLAHNCPDGEAVVLWDLAAGRARATLDGSCGPFEFAPDGQLLATAAAEGEATLWDVTGGRARAHLRKPCDSIGQLAFSPDGRLLATQHETPPLSRPAITEVNVWQVPSGELWAHLPSKPSTELDPQYVRPLQFSPDSRLLVVTCAATESPLRDVTTRPPTPLTDLGTPYSGTNTQTGQTWYRAGPTPVFSADGRWIVVPGEQPGTVAVVRAATRTRHVVLAPETEGRRRGLIYASPDGRTVAVAVSREVPRYERRGGWRTWLDLMLPRVVGTHRVGSVMLFEAETGRLVQEVPGDTWGGFTPDSHTFFTFAHDRNDQSTTMVARRWDVDPGPPVGLAVCVVACVLLVLVAAPPLVARMRRPRRASADALPMGRTSPC